MEEDSVKHDDILDFTIYYCLHDGSYPDCGVCAIAYATALSLGQDPGTLVFSQSEMRRHLFKMLKERKLAVKAECDSDRGQSHPSIL